MRDLAGEKRRLQRLLEELVAVSYEPIDAAAVLREGMTALRNLPALREAGSLEERKEFIHGFGLPDDLMFGPGTFCVIPEHNP